MKKQCNHGQQEREIQSQEILLICATRNPEEVMEDGTRRLSGEDTECNGLSNYRTQNVTA
jgi:hypothetical protein